MFYTYGVPEARSPGGEFFRAGRFEDLLRANRGGSARQICESTLRTLDEFQANERHDDVTILTLHRRR